MAEDEVKVLADAKKLPLPDRVAHSNWKARSAAYEDIAAACRGIYDPADPQLFDFGALFVKSVADSNAAAQDKALDALNAFLAKASEQHVSRHVEKTCSNIVTKALNARTSTVQKATEALLTYIELEQSAAVLDALVEGLKNKVVKAVLATLDVTILAVSLFGTKLLPPQPLLKALPEVLDSKDGKVREKGKELAVELSRWVGPDVVASTALKAARDAIKDDLMKGMQEAAKLGRPKPTRVTRKEQARLAELAAQQQGQPAEEGAGPGEAPAGGDGAAAAPAEEEPADADPYDFVEPRDVLKELKKEFWEGLESKKWSDRKAALTQLRELATYPRLAAGRDMDYGDVNRELRKVITKDSNVMCVAEAVACVGALAQGLRAAYSATAKNFVEVLVEKFKEKNASVGKAVAEALTAMHKHCWALMDVSETLAAALGHVSPKVKEDSLGWLKEAVGREAKPALTKLAAVLLPPAAKCAEDALPSMREAAMAFMVAFSIKLGTTAAMDKFTAKLDDGKKKRLEEMLAEARGAPPAGAAAAATTGAPSARASANGLGSMAAASTSPTQPSRPGPSAAAAALAASRTASRPSATRASLTGSAMSAAKPAARAGAATSSAAAAGGAAKKSAAEPEDEVTLASGSMSKDEAVAAMTGIFGESIIAQLQEATWKPRLDAMEAVLGQVQEGGLYGQCAVVVQGMSHLPGWDEKNFQVMGKQLEVVKLMAANAPSFSKRDALVAINGAIDKLSDTKLKGPAFEVLTAVSEVVGPAWVAGLLHKKAAAHKNPKVLSEMHVWLAQACLDFGLACFNVKSLLDWAKEDLQSANAGVRNSVIQMLGAMHRFLGPPLADMIRADVKPALMAALDAEFGKNPRDPSITPTRTSRADAAKRTAAGGKEGGPTTKGGAEASPGPSAAGDADELLPRTDIGGQLGGGLITQMGSAAWKERKEAMDAVDTLLAQAGGRIQPQLGDLVPALKARLADTNRNLAAQALQLCAKLARAMGRPADRALRPLLAPALKNYSDNKNNVRAAVSELMGAWAAASGLECVLPELVDALSSPKSTADGRAEALNWLASMAASSSIGGPHLGDVMRCVAVGVADKAAEVRDAANKLLAVLLQTYGAAKLNQAAACIEAAGPRKAVSDALAKQGGSAGSAAASGAVSAGVAASKTTLSTRPSTATGTTRPGSLSGATPSNRPPSVGRTRPSTAASKAPAGGLRTSLTLNRAGSMASSAAGRSEGDDGPLLLMDTKKEDRARKGKFRPAKLEVRPDEAATLEGELGPLVSPQLRALLFAKDFKRHCEAAELLREGLASLYAEALSVLDLLLRWCTLRMLESNTQVLVKVLELLKELTARMEAQGDKLSEYEAKLILPVLVEKAGHNQDKLRADHKELLQRASQVHPPVKVAVFIKDGLETKNNRARVVCAEELGLLIDKHGPAIYASPLTAVKAAPGGSADSLLAVIAKLVMERDNTLRSAALGCLEAAYAYEAEGLWRLLGSKVPDAARTLIEERLKYADRNLARCGLHPGYKAGTADSNGSSGSGQMGAAAANRPTTPGAATPGLLTSPRRPSSPSARSAGRPASPVASRPARPASPSGRSAGLSSSLHLKGPLSASSGAVAGRPASGVGAVAGGSGSILAGVQRSGIPSPTGVQPSRAANSTHALPSTRSSTEELPVRQSLDRMASQNSGASAMEVDTQQYLRSSISGFSSGADLAQANAVELTRMSKASAAEFRRDFQLCCNNFRGNCSLTAAEALEVQAVAIKLLCYELMEVPNYPDICGLVFREQANELIPTLARKLGAWLDEAGQVFARGEVVNTRPCKYAVNVLMSMSSMPVIAQEVQEDTLCVLVGEVLRALADERLAMHMEGVALLKALSLLSMKTLENCDRTNVFCCLITLLLDMPPSFRTRGPQQQAKLEYAWCDIVVKCLIKMTKALPTTIQQVDLRRVLAALHNFFVKLGPEEIGARAAREDKPLRMVKTVLHELCKLLGRAIFQYTDVLPNGDLDPALRPMIFAYIDLNLQTVGGQQRQAPPAAAAPQQRPAQPLAPPPPIVLPPAPAASSPIAPTSLVPPPSHPAAHLAPSTTAMTAAAVQPSAAVHRSGTADSSGGTAVPAGGSAGGTDSGALRLVASDEAYTQQVVDELQARNTLGAIFKRIAEQPGDRHQALVDLHFFTTANPQTGIEGMLGSASTTFRNFILRGLHKVRLALAQQQASGASGAGAPPTQQQQQAGPAGPQGAGHEAPQGSPDAEVAVTASYQYHAAGSGVPKLGPPPQVAALKLGGVGGLSSGGGSACYSPGSPSAAGKNTARNVPVVGEDKIAELRDRMARMQMDVSALPTRPSGLAASLSSLSSAPALTPSTSDPGGPPPAGLTATALPFRHSNNLGASLTAGGAAAGGPGLASRPLAVDEWGMSTTTTTTSTGPTDLAGLQERIRRLKEQEQ